MYKLFSGCLTNLVSAYCSNNEIIHREQKGARKGCWGCKDQLWVQKMILDSFSPLLFCWSLNPLSFLLNSEEGYHPGPPQHRSPTPLTHLLYMDDIELLAKGEDNLKRPIPLVESFSGDIGMTFRLDKCNTLH